MIASETGKTIRPCGVVGKSEVEVEVVEHATHYMD